MGGANALSGISVDAARDLVFVPTGSPAWDFWGGDRHGANLAAGEGKMGTKSGDSYVAFALPD